MHSRHRWHCPRHDTRHFHHRRVSFFGISHHLLRRWSLSLLASSCYIYFLSFLLSLLLKFLYLIIFSFFLPPRLLLLLLDLRSRRPTTGPFIKSLNWLMSRRRDWLYQIINSIHIQTTISHIRDTVCGDTELKILGSCLLQSTGHNNIDIGPLTITSNSRESHPSP
jgi:hypothetical protein